MRGAAANYVPARLNSLTAPPARIPTRGTTRTQKRTGRTLARTASRPEGHLDVRRRGAAALQRASAQFGPPHPLESPQRGANHWVCVCVFVFVYVCERACVEI